MGGRASVGSSTVLGKGRETIKIKRSIHKKLREKSPKIVAESVIAAVATQSPAVTALYLAYKVAKFVYPIVKKGVGEYKKTGDENKATEAMVEEAVKQTGKQVTGMVVENVVAINLDVIKSTTNIQTNEVVDKFIVTAVSKSVEEVMIE